MSQNSGSGTTQHEGWPDAIRCDINSPDWGVGSFYLTYAPISATYWGWERNKYVYRLHHADRISVIFDPDKDFYGYENISSTDCDNMTIPELYNAGKAFNFLSMPVCTNQQTLKFNDSTSAWECADTSTTLPYCINGQTLNFDAPNSQWVCAPNANLPICAEDQILQYNTTSTAWECEDAINSILPTCLDEQILGYNAAMLQWECKNEAAGSGSTLPTCLDGKIVSYDDGTTSWVCDNKRPNCTDSQILTYDSTSTDWECSDNNASMPSCLNNQILTYNEVTSLWECANNIGGVGGDTNENILALYKHTSQILTDLYTPLTFDNQIRIDDPFTHSTVTDSSTITIEEDGWYEMTYHLSTDVDSGNTRSGSTAKVEINIGGFWGDLPGTLTHMYNRNDVVGGTSASTSIWHEFSAGDKVRLMIRQESGTSTVATLPDSVGISIRKEGGLGDTLPVADTDWSVNGNDLRAGVIGNVGIGVAAPVSKLDVDGGIKFGDDVDVCDATKAGTTRFNSNKLQVCANDAWTDIGSDSSGVPSVFVEEDNINRSFSTAWADGITLKNRTIRDGWDLSLHYELPSRNDSVSWGGGYVEVQYSIDSSGIWYTLGNSGYQLAMGDGLEVIRTDNRTMYLKRSELTDAPVTGDFDVQFKFRHKSYDGTLYINENRGTSDSKFSSLFVIKEEVFEY